MKRELHTAVAPRVPGALQDRVGWVPDRRNYCKKRAGGSPQRKFFWKIGVAESDGLSGIRTGADE